MQHTTSAAPPIPAAAGHPSGDKRFMMLETMMKRHHFAQDALIEVLHHAQQLFGYLGHDLLYFITRHLKLPPSKVFGVATFYHLFRLKPTGEHTCVVCDGTACYVKGADALIEAVEREAHIQVGETTDNGKLSLLTARCLGACGIAPVVVLDDAIKGHFTPEALLDQVKGWIRRGPARTPKDRRA
jgi:bidirectional [NiFe] hydrogenase diaphorase subunit